jgi:type III secretion protein C
MTAHARPWLAALAEALIATLAALHPTVARAMPPDGWKDALYSYRGAALSLGDVLSTFARSMGVELRVAKGLAMQQRVSVDPGAVSPVVFLNRVAFVHGLQWFVYGGVLYVSSASGSVTERIALDTMTAASAKQALIGLGLFEPKFGWGELDEAQAAAVVFGPQAYIELAKGAVGKSAAAKDATEPQVMIFRLKYASAADAQMTLRDRSVTRQGVASVLRALLGSEHDRTSWPDDFKSPGPIASVRQGAAEPTSGIAPPPLSAKRSQAPAIEAYAPLNAVVVRDRPDKRKVYEDLITALDVPPRQVEIDATIVDADVDTLREWSAGLTIGGTRNAFTSDLGTGNANATVVLASLNRLMLRLRSLESKGFAEVLSRPSIMTLDNQGAVLDLSQSAHFRLVGERIADLKSITVGTMLRVTPRVLSDAASAPVRIDIDIEDGNIQDTGDRGTTAQTARSTISTQAILLANQALVIGGFKRERSLHQKSKVPVLGSLPLLGRLFQADSDGTNRRERLFILTARVVDPLATQYLDGGQ